MKRERIKKGQRVHFLPEWMDEGDDKLEWFAYDDEEYKRVSVTADLGLRFNGIQTVDVSMLVEGQEE